MRVRTVSALVVGVAAAAAAVAYAGAGAVVRAVASLGIGGLSLLVLLHLPIAIVMGVAWWSVAGENPPASRGRFAWARLVRDAAGEILPFLYLGGLALGLRALGPGRTLTGAVSAGIDGMLELTAKLPYVLAALLCLLALAPPQHVTTLLSSALAITSAGVASLLFAHRWVGASLQRIVRFIGARWPRWLCPDEAAAGHDVRGCLRQLLSQRRRLWWGFTLHLCCWCAGAVEAWLTFVLLRVHLTLWQALAIDGTVVGLRTFGVMVPAAVGIQEASYLLAGAAFGMSPVAAIAASFARRARDLLLGVAVLGIAAAREHNLTVLRRSRC